MSQALWLQSAEGYHSPGSDADIVCRYGQGSRSFKDVLHNNITIACMTVSGEAVIHHDDRTR
jgi:hypothetical protein